MKNPNLVGLEQDKDVQFVQNLLDFSKRKEQGSHGFFETSGKQKLNEESICLIKANQAMKMLIIRNRNSKQVKSNKQILPTKSPIVLHQQQNDSCRYHYNLGKIFKMKQLTNQLILRSLNLIYKMKSKLRITRKFLTLFDQSL
ncbi:UNKNOWN [Stylonychia lemnae]|uniref:Uncharacterized protein n=1 Tax=Stylonychia lemnae TaxID=5949 RepID=A0A078B467_STYLE|nr:UNKNOWN [Stylonychia lemnae]|eukprot:CDW87997.1 UNKNOWN [Stylonychia lemnae]